MILQGDEIVCAGIKRRGGILNESLDHGWIHLGIHHFNDIGYGR
jgi:hypothetical protein